MRDFFGEWGFVCLDFHGWISMDGSSAPEFSVNPVALLDLACLYEHLLAPTVLFVVLPMPQIVITITINLPTIAVSFLVVATLALVDVAVGLREDQTADSLAPTTSLVELAVDLCSVLVDRLAIAEGEI